LNRSNRRNWKRVGLSVKLLRLTGMLPQGGSLIHEKAKESLMNRRPN